MNSWNRPASRRSPPKTPPRKRPKLPRARPPSHGSSDSPGGSAASGRGIAPRPDGRRERMWKDNPDAVETIDTLLAGLRVESVEAQTWGETDGSPSPSTDSGSGATGPAPTP